MSEKQHYLIRRLADGTMRTVTAQSCRGAMGLFIGQYKPPADEIFLVKARGTSDEWEAYKVTRTGNGYGMRKVHV